MLKIKMKVFICIIALILFLKPLSAKDIKNEYEYLLTAEGAGKTAKEAKENSLVSLSQSIFVKVENVFESKDTVEDDKATSYTTNKTLLSTASYFSGLHFSSPKQVGSGDSALYKVDVAMTQESYKATIDNLVVALKVNQIDLLSDYELQKELEKAKFLRAMFGFGKSKNIEYKEDSYRVVTSYVKDLEYRTSIAAKVLFNISPQDAQATITIDDRKYSSNQRIFLPEGEFNYTIKSKKYKTTSGKLKVFFKDNVVINIDMQVLLIKNAPVKLNLEVLKNSGILRFLNKSQFTDTLSYKLQDLQLELEDSAKATLLIEFKNPISGNLGGVDFITIPVYVNLKSSKGTVFIAKDIKITNAVVDHNIDYNNMVEAIINELKDALGGNKILDFSNNK